MLISYFVRLAYFPSFLLPWLPTVGSLSYNTALEKHLWGPINGLQKKELESRDTGQRGGYLRPDLQA